jgi:hypothetical protein
LSFKFQAVLPSVGSWKKPGSGSPEARQLLFASAALSIQAKSITSLSFTKILVEGFGIFSSIESIGKDLQGQNGSMEEIVRFGWKVCNVYPAIRASCSFLELQSYQQQLDNLARNGY